VSTGAGSFQVNLWGGGTGFRLDKIVLTTNPEGPQGGGDRAPSFIRATTPTWNQVRTAAYQTYSLNGRYGGPPDTGGRNGMACDPCNALYGLRVEGLCDNTQDDLYDDAQPVRAAKEAAKTFVHRLRARFDQVGFVEYETHSKISREMNCIWLRQTVPVGYGPGIWDFETNTPDQAWTWCFDHRTAGGTPDDSRTGGSVISAIEEIEPAVWTDIAGGLRDGIDVLKTGEGHYGRPYAKRYIVLMTDGVPNRWPGYPKLQACHADSEAGASTEQLARDCANYYAEQAKTAGIRVFVIGLGLGVDEAWLKTITTEPADYIAAATAEELNAAFAKIASRLDLRLVE
jgi:hypothetical protein